MAPGDPWRPHFDTFPAKCERETQNPGTPSYLDKQSARGRYENMEPQAIWVSSLGYKCERETQNYGTLSYIDCLSVSQVREGDTKLWNPKLSRQAIWIVSVRGRHKTMEPQTI